MPARAATGPIRSAARVRRQCSRIAVCSFQSASSPGPAPAACSTRLNCLSGSKVSRARSRLSWCLLGGEDQAGVDAGGRVLVEPGAQVGRRAAAGTGRGRRPSPTRRRRRAGSPRAGVGEPGVGGRAVAHAVEPRRTRLAPGARARALAASRSAGRRRLVASDSGRGLGEVGLAMVASRRARARGRSRSAGSRSGAAPPSSAPRRWCSRRARWRAPGPRRRRSSAGWSNGRGPWHAPARRRPRARGWWRRRCCR